MGRGGDSGAGLQQKHCIEEAVFKMLLEGTPKLEGREVEVSWGHIGIHRPPCLEFVDKGRKSGWGP